MRIRTLLRQWQSKFGFAGAAGVTLWILSTYPPDRPVWRYIAWKGVLAGAWLIAVLIWAWPRAKRRLLILGGLIVMSATWAVAFVVFFPTLEPLEVKTFHI